MQAAPSPCVLCPLRALSLSLLQDTLGVNESSFPKTLERIFILYPQPRLLPHSPLTVGKELSHPSQT